MEGAGKVLCSQAASLVVPLINEKSFGEDSWPRTSHPCTCKGKHFFLFLGKDGTGKARAGGGGLE